MIFVHAIVFEKLCFEIVFRPHSNQWKAGVFKFLVDGRHDYREKAQFSNFPEAAIHAVYYEMQEGVGKSLGWEAEKDFMSYHYEQQSQSTKK